MKKRVLVTVLLIAVLLLLPSAVSAGMIGYVNFEFLFYAHPEYDAKNRHLQDKAEELYAKIQEEAEAMETEEEIEQLGAHYEYQFDLIEQEVRIELVSFILEIIEEIALANDIEAVLPENSIIYGGIDLTEQIVEAMYRHYGISVPSSIREQM